MVRWLTGDLNRRLTRQAQAEFIPYCEVFAIRAEHATIVAMHRWLRIIGVWSVMIVLSACTGSVEPVVITRILSSTQPIVEGEPLPTFGDHFQTGATIIYSYVFLENTKTMTGSFPVRLRWFHPNDFRPPMAQHIVMMEPGQEVAQFEIHNDSGLLQGPYQLIARTGPDQSNFTASGSSRFFIGMTEEEAQTFIAEEDEYRRKREEERLLREAEEAATTEEAKEEKEAKEAKEFSAIGSTATESEIDIDDEPSAFSE